MHHSTDGMGAELVADVERVKNQNVVVVLGQRYDVALRRDLQSAASANLHVRTLKLSEQRTVALEDSDVETVAMAVSDENVTCRADVNAIREAGHLLAADATQKFTHLPKHYHTVTLQIRCSQT